MTLTTKERQQRYRNRHRKGDMRIKRDLVKDAGGTADECQKARYWSWNRVEAFIDKKEV